MSQCLAQLPDFSVVGPKLLYADGNLQHAGMYFFRLPNGVFQNMHYYKGYGRDFGPANIAREVPAVTGAVMALKRSSFLGVGSFTTDYVIGDYEDSDLCLKLRARGGVCQYLPDSGALSLRTPEHCRRTPVRRVADRHPIIATCITAGGKLTSRR